MTVCHRDPEADALGSALSVALALEARGARVNAVCADPVPAMYDFMPQIERFRTSPEPDLDPDLIVVCDCGDLERVGPVLTEHAELFARVPIVDIDHHLSNPGFGAVDWVDADGRGDVRAGGAAPAAPGSRASTPSTGPSPRTSWPASSSTRPTSSTPTRRRGRCAWRASCSLPARSCRIIARRIYRTKPNAQLRLFGRVLARLETSADGRLVWSVMADGDLRGERAGPQMSEGLIDLLAQSESADVVILFKDHGDRGRACPCARAMVAWTPRR